MVRDILHIYFIGHWVHLEESKKTVDTLTFSQKMKNKNKTLSGDQFYHVLYFWIFAFFIHLFHWMKKEKVIWTIVFWWYYEHTKSAVNMLCLRFCVLWWSSWTNSCLQLGVYNFVLYIYTAGTTGTETVVISYKYFLEYVLVCMYILNTSMHKLEVLSLSGWYYLLCWAACW